jgi:hypothetical protein
VLKQGHSDTTSASRRRAATSPARCAATSPALATLHAPRAFPRPSRAFPRPSRAFPTPRVPRMPRAPRHCTAPRSVPRSVACRSAASTRDAAVSPPVTSRHAHRLQKAIPLPRALAPPACILPVRRRHPCHSQAEWSSRPCPTPHCRPRPSPSPTRTHRTARGSSQAGSSPEQSPPRPCSRCAAGRPAAGSPPPIRGHKSTVGEPLATLLPFPDRFRRRITGIWAGAATLHAPAATLQALEKFQGVLREPGA